jgi:hypothetical protein
VNLTLFEEPAMGAGTVLQQLAAAGVTLSLDDVRAWTKYELALAYDWARRTAILRESPASGVTGRPKPSFVAAAQRRAAAPEGMKDVALLRDRHRKGRDSAGAPEYCAADGQPWPCDVARALDALEDREPGIPRRASRALEVIAEYGGNDSAHHQQWVLDQAARHLTGCVYEPATGTTGEPLGHDRLGTSGAYLAWRPEGWDKGIAP